MDVEKLTAEFVEAIYEIYKMKPSENFTDFLQGEMRILTHLFDAGGSLSPTELSELMYVSTARITAVLNNLEKKAFVTRIPSTQDKRKICVQLTKDGKNAFLKRQNEVFTVLSLIFSMIGKADSECLIKIIKKISFIMQKNNA